ncbi:MAG: PspC domain-containing protein [bacterium]
MRKNKNIDAKLKRSNDRYLGGVCGGIADYIGMKHLTFRIIWSVLTLISLIIPGLLTYAILWIIMFPPEE